MDEIHENDTCSISSADEPFPPPQKYVYTRTGELVIENSRRRRPIPPPPAPLPLPVLSVSSLRAIPDVYVYVFVMALGHNVCL